MSSKKVPDIISSASTGHRHKKRVITYPYREHFLLLLGTRAGILFEVEHSNMPLFLSQLENWP